MISLVTKMLECRKCFKDKSISEFSFRRDSNTYRKVCKECRCFNEKNRYKREKTSINKRNNEYYKNNSDKVKEKRKNYRLKNKEKILETHRKYYRKWNFEQIIKNNLRNRLRKALKNKQKSGSAIRDLGCSVGDLKFWLEKQFEPGMTWENYGDWHIDHIIPLSSFNLTNNEEVKKACNWFNLRPLWAKENIVKSNKIPGV